MSRYQDGGAYAPRVDMLGQELPLKPEIFRAAYNAAMHEIETTGAITFRAIDDKGRMVWNRFVIRCGKRLRHLLCLRPRGHAGFCWHEWDDGDGAEVVKQPYAQTSRQRPAQTRAAQEAPAPAAEPKKRAATPRKPREQKTPEGQGSLF